ncbi:hypothetical protein [Sphingosinicella soli]|uniref:Uncharacterized protein n=1 Tax=Sphingosinicella soli TaxID=333708 RepID=A0A7W7F8K6_9SPHN|nr:hypothetical protein [Sphingosinicella soli]MBB4633829.1 hypothetical protein [Sphingosinicella soli]
MLVETRGSRHRQVKIAVGGRDKTHAAGRLKVMVTHQALDPLIIGDHALVAERSLQTAPTLSFERGANRCDSRQQFGIAEPLGQVVVECGPCDAHQPTSSGDRHPAGPVITDVLALIGRDASRRAPLKTPAPAPVCR